jgi:hypothetical protein
LEDAEGLGELHLVMFCAFRSSAMRVPRAMKKARSSLLMATVRMSGLQIGQNLFDSEMIIRHRSMPCMDLPLDGLSGGKKSVTFRRYYAWR